MEAPGPPKLDYATPQPRRKPALRLIVGFFGVLMGMIAIYLFCTTGVVVIHEIFSSRRNGQLGVGVVWTAIGLAFGFMSVRWCRFAIMGPPE